MVGGKFMVRNTFVSFLNCLNIGELLLRAMCCFDSLTALRVAIRLYGISMEMPPIRPVADFTTS